MSSLWCCVRGVVSRPDRGAVKVVFYVIILVRGFLTTFGTVVCGAFELLFKNFEMVFKKSFEKEVQGFCKGF